MAKPDTATLFPECRADGEESQPAVIESLCVNCLKNGSTRILLTRVPHCKELIIMSFHCDHCGYHNNEVQSGSQVQEQGLKLVAKITSKEDLNRQVVKSEYSSISIPDVEFEIPHNSQPTEITTVEGILDRAASSLLVGQASRKTEDPKLADQIAAFIARLEELKSGSRPFTLILDDPSGNSYIENPFPAQVDRQVTTIHYHRTLDHNKMLGLVADDTEEPPISSNEASDDVPPVWESKDAIHNEVLHFATNCPNCNAVLETNMKFVNIPHFKDVVIMACVCQACGYRTSEVKSGGAISDHGTKLTLHVTKPEDFTRDVLKSETCALAIPELELEVGMGALSGRFTTVEGIISEMRQQLSNEASFATGDSADATSSRSEGLRQLMLKFDCILSGDMPIHLILDDSAGNSYIQSLNTPDDRLVRETYQRSWEQDEELGINDMKLEQTNDST